MHKFTSLIKKADMVGIGIKPTLNGTNRVKSFLGGTLTIAIITCILFGFVYFGLEMIRKDNPIMNIVQNMRTKAEIPVKKNPPMFGIADEYGNLLHTNPEFMRSIEIVALFYVLERDSQNAFKMNRYDGTVKTCDRSVIDPQVWDELVGIGAGVNVMLCLDPESLTDIEGKRYSGDISLRNRFGEMDSMYLWYQIKYCDEAKDPGCRDIFKSLGSSVNLAVYRLNYYVDQTDYDSPVKPDISSLGFKLSNTVTQAVYTTSQINEIITDSSLFLSETESAVYYRAKDQSTSISDYNEEERVLFQVVFSVDRIVNVNQRRYLKIPEMLANMGGFMKAAFAIANALSYFYSEYIYYIEVNRLETKHSRVIIEDKSSASINKQSTVVNALTKPTKPRKRDQFSKIGFFKYVWYFFKCENKKINKKFCFRYLELNYLIGLFLFVEELKETKDNNYVGNK